MSASRCIVAPFELDRPCFAANIEHVLVPALRTADIAIMDSLPAHKATRVQALIETAGARLRQLPLRL